MRILLSFAGALLLLALAVSAQTSGSGSSASGSGMGMVTCDILGCSHGCNETQEGPLCYCPVGFLLGDDVITCEVCPGGYWGMDCTRLCNCGTRGNPCNAVSGDCECTSCYEGANCANPVGYDCFTEFLAIGDKAFNIVSRLYGGDAFPTPPDGTMEGLVATELMEIDVNIVYNVVLVSVDRVEVDQAPLAKLTWTVDLNVNRPEALVGLVRLETKVKVGDIRATLIIQELIDTVEVTINAGTSL